MFFDPWYFIILAPALLLGLWAQMRVKSAFAKAEHVPAPLSGAAAARHVLDSAGQRRDIAAEAIKLRDQSAHDAWGDRVALRAVRCVARQPILLI